MSTTDFDPGSIAVQKLLAKLNDPFKMRLFFLWKLPSLLLWKVRVLSVDPDVGKVAIPFSWRAQNPFRSTYFAALSGAGELSTGLLAMIAMEGRGQMSMLVTKVEAEYMKKAVGTTVFTCTAGPEIREAVQRAYDTGEGQQVSVSSTGTGEDGTMVCRVVLHWSFKARKGSIKGR